MDDMKAKATYDFSLILSGIEELTEEVVNPLYEAGCDDALIGCRAGTFYADFTREASSLMDAISSAITQVEQSGIGVKVTRVDDTNLVSQAEIARKTNHHRQMVNQWVSGKRGPASFPAPACNLKNGTKLWAWTTVSSWLAANGLMDKKQAEDAEVLAFFNNALEQRIHRLQNPAMADAVTSILAKLKKPIRRKSKPNQWKNKKDKIGTNV